MLKGAKKHQAVIEGLKRATKILWSHIISNEGTIPGTNFERSHGGAVLDLYIRLLEYQDLGARYSGKPAINILGEVRLELQ